MADAHAVIPEALLLARLERAEEMRTFFLRMWLENTALAKAAGARIGTLLQPLDAVPPAPTFSLLSQAMLEDPV